LLVEQATNLPDHQHIIDVDNNAGYHVSQG
jgi:hypothetical protein